MKTVYTHLAKQNPSGRIYAEHAGRHKTTPQYQSDCYLALYIAHGSGTLEADETTIPLTEGDIFLFNPDITYHILPIKGLRRIDVYLCYFDFDVIENSYLNFRTVFPDLENFFNGDISYIRAVDTENKEIRDIFIQMIDEQMSGNMGSYNIIYGCLYILIAKILRNTKTRNFKRVFSKDRTVDEAIRYINNNLYSKVSLESIAKEVKVSPSYMCRQFKKHTGMTTAQFVNMLRTEKIKDILKNTDKPIRAIPEMFGCGVDYLKKVFKAETGMTMQEYRAKYHYKICPSDKRD